MNEFTYRLLMSLVPLSIMSLVFFSVARARSIKRIPIRENEFRVVYRTKNSKLGMQLGILRINDGMVTLTDKNGTIMTQQQIADVQVKHFAIKVPLWEMSSKTNSFDKFTLQMAAFYGWELSEGDAQDSALATLLEEQNLFSKAVYQPYSTRMWSQKNRKLIYFVLAVLVILSIVSRL